MTVGELIDWVRPWSLWKHAKDCNAWDTNYKGFTLDRCTCYMRVARIIVEGLDE